MVLLRLSRESVHRTAPAGFLPPVSLANFLDCYSVIEVGFFDFWKSVFRHLKWAQKAPAEAGPVWEALSEW